MENKENKKHILLSTDIFNYSYDDYLEWCEECEVEPIYPEDSSEFFGWCHEQVDQDIDCDCENMRYSKYANRNFVITGSLGLWDGKHIIQPVVMNGLVDTIMKCVSGRDICNYDVFINDDEDYITVHAMHHDGTNVFQIHLLSSKGAINYNEAYEKWNYEDGPEPELKPEYFERIEFNNIF